MKFWTFVKNSFKNVDNESKDSSENSCEDSPKEELSSDFTPEEAEKQELSDSSSDSSGKSDSESSEDLDKDKEELPSETSQDVKFSQEDGSSKGSQGQDTSQMESTDSQDSSQSDAEEQLKEESSQDLGDAQDKLSDKEIDSETSEDLDKDKDESSSETSQDVKSQDQIESSKEEKGQKDTQTEGSDSCDSSSSDTEEQLEEVSQEAKEAGIDTEEKRGESTQEIENKSSEDTIQDKLDQQELSDIEQQYDSSGEFSQESDSLSESSKEEKGQEETQAESSDLKDSSLSDEEDKKETLKNFRDILTKIKEKKEVEEKQKELEINNELKDKLKDIPSWKDRQRGGSYSIDTSYNGEIPDSVIKTLINKFLRQKFCKKKSTLNSRSTSLEKSRGYFKWDYMGVLKHLETEELTKIPLDRYDYLPAQGKNEDVPLSFYFDLSGSMSEYTGLLSTISILLLKQNVKVLVGFNQNVHVQIDSIKEIDSVSDLEKMLIKFGDYGYNGEKDKIIKDKGILYRNISENLDSYLIRKKAEKCVVFSDFHPISEVMNLSRFADVYWFCFEKTFSKNDLYDKYYGFLYKVQSLEDIIKGLERVNERRFESLMFIDDDNILKRRNI